MRACYDKSSQEDTTIRQQVLAKAAAAKRHLLEPEAFQLLRTRGLPIPEHCWATSQEQALEAFHSIGAPIVMKVVSSGILHKSDAGGVRLNVSSPERVIEVWNEMKACADRLDLPFQGVLVVEQAQSSLEIIVGAMRDEEFGPVAMVGAGGVLVEILRSPVFFMAPVSPEKVLAELTKGVLGRLMGGERGRKPLDKSSLAQVVSSVSALLAEHPEISEVDLNPVVVYPDGVKILDARILMAPQPQRKL